MNGPQRQLAGALIVILTVAAVIAAGINLQQQHRYRLPEDGVTWVDRQQNAGKSASGAEIVKNSVVALHIVPGSPGDRDGLHEGDVLRRIENVPVQAAANVAEILVGIGQWKKADYHVERRYKRAGNEELTVEVKYQITIGERVTPAAVYYEYLVGAAYLFVGLFVFFRRGDAHKALHFYLLCLAGFVLYTFHYTGKLNNFDEVIYFGNVFAGLFMPSLFVHFALTFPAPPRWLSRWYVSALLYLPAAVLGVVWIGVLSGILRIAISPIELRWLFDRIWLAFVNGGQLLGAAILTWRYRSTADPIARQQIKWLRNGAVFGVLPFTALYVLPYLFGAVLGPSLELSVLALVLVPITWAYAIFRYRLMDVDIIFQQGYVYTLATLAVLGVFYGLVFSLTASVPHPEGGPGGRLDDLSPGALVILILIAAFVFQPVRNWLQEILDRHFFYKDRYDYRRTLIEFARELGSETDMNRMLNAVADRLIRTLSIGHLAFFLNDENNRRRLYMTAGIQRPVPDMLDLSFLSNADRSYLFFERTRGPFDAVNRDWPQTIRHTIADLDLTYYIPCTARGRVIAYLGVSRTTEGDFLSSDDVELLQTLCGYVGIAIENARLYRSLERKAEEYERLKEFSENIVESINVGIAAADFEDRIESWNSQMENLTGIKRDEAVGKRIRELFPPELANEITKARGENGFHNIYKFPLSVEGSGDRILNIALAPLVSREHEHIGRLVLFDDVTERAVLENRLVQADKLSSLGLMAAGVAHEVNTPLAVISTYAQLLAKQVNGDDTKSRLLEKIAKQTFRASEIVNSLLNFSRTSSTEYEEVDLNRVVQETLQLIEPQLDKVGIRVTTEMEECSLCVKGNSGKLQQVFLNLFLNARDAMEGGGSLGVRSWCDDAVARIEVRDTGCGIPEEQLTRIYDPFFTTKGAKKGTGLGLSITYGIVKEHGGSIVVASQPGQGTCFQLEFPLVRKPVNA